jgi:hypothetical protein
MILKDHYIKKENFRQMFNSTRCGKDVCFFAKQNLDWQIDVLNKCSKQDKPFVLENNFWQDFWQLEVVFASQTRTNIKMTSFALH